ncbi:MAG: BolA family transcriptional regulator [Alphaproteobacteria bacterium]|nr:BolA family transcriptional regulator [Alphaproteobacteria bacterium]
MKMEDVIKKEIQARFTPSHFELINESHKHHGHAGDDGSGQTHFKLLIVSSVFEGQGRVERQRGVNTALETAFSSGLHAINMKLFTPTEFE